LKISDYISTVSDTFCCHYLQLISAPGFFLYTADWRWSPASPGGCRKAVTPAALQLKCVALDSNLIL